MNLRILKKLSKRAAPLLTSTKAFSYLNTDQFISVRGEGNTETQGHDRKHWERGNARNPIDFHGYLYWPARNGLGHPYMHDPSTPLKGTVMLGWSQGYEEPEWEERTAWELLESHVRDCYSEYVEIPGTEDEFGIPDFKWVVHRRFKNPRQIFKAIADGLPQ